MTNENFIHRKIKSRLNSGNSCDHSRSYILFSRLLSSARSGPEYTGRYTIQALLFVSEFHTGIPLLNIIHHSVAFAK
jgi:hypothetical protein